MADTTTAKTIKYGRLLKPHPDLDLEYTHTLRALYKGGKALLRDEKVMERVFPKHSHEGAASYNERKSRAFYEPVFAQCVNKIVAGLGQDPARLDPQPDASGKIAEGATIEDYWKDLQHDSTPPNDDGEAKTFDQVIRSAICEALVARRAWMLCDMPPAMPAESRKEQEDAGALDAYPVMYRADQVTDWYETKGILKWVRCYSCSVPADDPTKERAFVRHEWQIWDDVGWTTYVVELDKNGQTRTGTRITKDSDIPSDPTLSGTHAFGRVPWVCLDTAADDEPNMWIGDLIESQVRNFFNQSCGDAYQRLRHMFQQLYEFLGSEYGSVGGEIPSETQQNPARARGRRRGPDVIQERGKDDSAMYVSPNMDGADIAAQAIDASRESITRVTGQLALAQDTSGATIRRSGDSKKQDKIEEEVVLGAAGKKLLGFARQVVKLLAIGRKDKSEPVVTGYQSFDVDDTDDVIAQAAEIEGISVPSATFQIEYKFRVACSVLGDDLDQDTRQQIRDELSKTITQDQFTMPMVVDPEDPNADDDGDPGADDPSNPRSDPKTKPKTKPAPTKTPPPKKKGTPA